MRIDSARKHAEAGFSREQIRTKFNVSKKTMNRWFDKLVSKGIEPPMELWPENEYLGHHILILVRDFPHSTPTEIVRDLANLYDIQTNSFTLKLAVSKLDKLGLLKMKKVSRRWKWFVSSDWNSDRSPAAQ